MQYNLILLRRGCDPADILVLVTFDVDRTVISDLPQLLQTIRSGVTKWAKNTEEGRELYKYAGDDMNIGDLLNADWLQIMPYCPGLRGVVFNDDFVVPKDWDYDTPLCEEIEDDDEESSEADQGEVTPGETGG